MLQHSCLLLNLRKRNIDTDLQLLWARGRNAGIYSRRDLLVHLNNIYLKYKYRQTLTCFMTLVSDRFTHNTCICLRLSLLILHSTILHVNIFYMQLERHNNQPHVQK